MTAPDFFLAAFLLIVISVLAVGARLFFSNRNPLRRSPEERGQQAAEIRVEIVVNDEVTIVAWPPRTVLDERGFLGLGAYLAETIGEDVLSNRGIAQPTDQRETSRWASSPKWLVAAVLFAIPLAATTAVALGTQGPFGGWRGALSALSALSAAYLLLRQLVGGEFAERGEDHALSAAYTDIARWSREPDGPSPLGRTDLSK